MQNIHIVLQGEIFYQGTAVLDNQYAARYSGEFREFSTQSLFTSDALKQHIKNDMVE